MRADGREFDRIVDRAIAERRAHPSDDPFDVLAVLVADVSLTDSEIRDQVDTFDRRRLRHDRGVDRLDDRQRRRQG